MCGILGVVGEAGSDTLAALLDQSRRMRRRGPDGEGTWTEGSAALAHRRLAILDLSDRSRQPLLSADGRYSITFNGEIYNFRQLSEPPLAGDTLTLLQGAPPLATEPTRLRGMFAYGLLDRDKESLLLVRDRFGIKPLYYSETERSLAFGSTASSVGALGRRAEIDTAALASYLRSGSVQGPQSILQGVREVDPGWTLTWNDGASTQSPYWRFEEARQGARPSLRSVLLESVALHGVSDVPVALFLSGGVDSALLGDLAVDVGLDITAFTLGFPGSPIDEVEDASETARALGLDHKVVMDTGHDPDFDAFFATVDQPTIDGLNTYLVSQAAAHAGFKVAMTGLGADELFGGYSTFRRVPALWALSGIPSAALKQRLIGRSQGNHAKTKELVSAGSSLNRIHEELRSVFSRDEVRRLTGHDWVAPDRPVSAAAPMDAVTRMEIDRYLRNTLLRDADVFSMAHSLELRTPFVDHAVLGAALSTSNVRRAYLRKRLLARAASNPRVFEVLKKPKRGFRLPMDRWLRGPLADRVDALAEGPVASVCDMVEIRAHVDAWRSGGSNQSKMWSLVVLDGWLRSRADPTFGRSDAFPGA